MNPDALRTMVAGFLTDTCTIRGRGAAKTFNPSTGVTTQHAGEIVYTGACRATPASGGQVVQAGEQPVTLATFDVRLPWDTTGVKVDQTLVITDSDDPHLLGRILRVVDVQGASNDAYRKVICEDTRTIEPWAEEGS